MCLSPETLNIKTGDAKYQNWDFLWEKHTSFKLFGKTHSSQSRFKSIWLVRSKREVSSQNIGGENHDMEKNA